jgi:N-hydroxyarylamine O-acetyltransferase
LAWLADVGFGSSPPGPLPFPGGPRELNGWWYLVTSDSPGTWKLRERQGGDWVTMYTIEDQRVYPVDVVVANHYTSTYPESWFIRQPIVVRREPGAIRSLIGRTYTVTRPGHVKERRELSDREFAAALSEIFGLSLTQDELARLTVLAGQRRALAAEAGEQPGDEQRARDTGEAAGDDGHGVTERRGDRT